MSCLISYIIVLFFFPSTLNYYARKKLFIHSINIKHFFYHFSKQVCWDASWSFPRGTAFFTFWIKTQRAVSTLRHRQFIFHVCWYMKGHIFFSRDNIFLNSNNILLRFKKIILVRIIFFISSILPLKKGENRCSVNSYQSL